MQETNPEITQKRVGKQFRSNPDRYFHIMAEGWYLFTREGIKGPFYDKSQAASYLLQHIQGSEYNPDPSSSWRL